MNDQMSFSTILQIILEICILIMFFVAATNVSKIYDVIIFFKNMELNKSENWKTFNCTKCGKEIRVHLAQKSPVNCSYCKTANKIIR